MAQGLLAPDQQGQAAGLSAAVAALLDDMQAYLQQPRPYARHFTVATLSASAHPRPPLAALGYEIGMLTRHVHRSLSHVYQQLQALAARGALHDAGHAALLRAVGRLHASFEALSAAKEARAPLAMRASLTNYAALVVPIFGGPFWSYTVSAPGAQMLLRHGDRVRSDEEQRFGLVFAMINAVVMQVMLMSLLGAASALEDPFGEGPQLDLVSLAEAKAAVLFMAAPGQADKPTNGGGTGDSKLVVDGGLGAAADAAASLDAGVEGCADGQKPYHRHWRSVHTQGQGAAVVQMPPLMPPLSAGP